MRQPPRLKQNLPSNIGNRGKNGEFIIEFPCIPRKKGKLVDYMFSLGNAESLLRSKETQVTSY